MAHPDGPRAAAVLGRIVALLAALAGLAWLVASHPRVFVPALLIGNFAVALWVTRYPRRPPRAPRRPPRLAIKHLMIAAAVVSVPFALARWIVGGSAARDGSDPAAAISTVAGLIFAAVVIGGYLLWQVAAPLAALARSFGKPSPKREHPEPAGGPKAGPAARSGPRPEP